MPAKPGTARSRAVARLAGVTSRSGPDDPRIPDLRRDLRAAELEEHAARLVADWPPLTDEQRARIGAILFASPAAPPSTSDSAA